MKLFFYSNRWTVIIIIKHAERLPYFEQYDVFIVSFHTYIGHNLLSVLKCTDNDLPS